MRPISPLLTCMQFMVTEAPKCIKLDVASQREQQKKMRAKELKKGMPLSFDKQFYANFMNVNTKSDRRYTAQ